MRTIAIGDIHGCINPFNDLLEKICLSKEDKLVLLGDYIDRGPDSKAVLDKIIDLKDKGFDITPLLGNHEMMLLRSIENPKFQKMWRLNGGETSLQSFNCSNPIEIPEIYKIFLNKMPHFLKLGKYIFVHAGLNEDSETPYSDTESMLWIRKGEYMQDFIQENTIIHGHTPISLLELKKDLKNKPKVINLDTGCVYNHRAGLGYLSAYCINTSELFTVQNQ